MSHEPTQENRDIRFEGTDTDNRSIAILGLVILGILFSISLSMIPFVRYMWKTAEQRSSVSPAAPEKVNIILEVTPSDDLKKMRAEHAGSDKKIEAAMNAALKEGFPVGK